MIHVMFIIKWKIYKLVLALYMHCFTQRAELPTGVVSCVRALLSVFVFEYNIYMRKNVGLK